MTKQDFMRFCEEYYGEKYNEAVFSVMDNYLDKKSGPFLDAAATVLVKRFSRTNRITPGPAEIERHLDEILDSIPEIGPPEPEERLSDAEREEGSKKLLCFIDELKSRDRIKALAI
jgi:hypothetical protein